MGKESLLKWVWMVIAWLVCIGVCAGMVYNLVDIQRGFKMSGGYFDYDQYKLGYIADSLEQIIIDNNNEEIDEWGSKKGRFYSPETIKRLKEAEYYCRLAQIYAHRADWLISCDDGEESFHRRLNEEIEEFKRQYNEPEV